MERDAVVNVKFTHRSRVDSSPTGDGAGTAARVPVSVPVVIDWHVCEAVNHLRADAIRRAATCSGNILQMVLMT